MNMQDIVMAENKDAIIKNPEGHRAASLLQMWATQALKRMRVQ